MKEIETFFHYHKLIVNKYKPKGNIIENFSDKINNMKVYFVRHGSTDLVERRISQPNWEPLSERGKKQAKELAKRFENTSIDLVISSSHQRALETAKFIRNEVEINELFDEVKKPKEVIGQSKDNEKVKAILKKIGEMYLVDPSWHYDDEENFVDLKNRGIKAIEYLKSLNKENVLVVSHGNFIALIMGLMMFKEDFSVNISLKLKNFFRLGVTGVSICTYEDDKWKLQCWNDTSHLLE